MYFFYLDESGEKNPAVKREEPYVLLALGMHEFQVKRFEHAINARKIKLISEINSREGIKLDLADAEIRSSDVRIIKNREDHPFLKYLLPQELNDLIDLFYQQLEDRHIKIFASVIDKNCLDGYMDIEKSHKKAYELLIERAETFLKNLHKNQNAIFVLDNTSKQLNRIVAMKHSYFQRSGTTSNVKLNHILGLPFFVESYLSNGVQLADLCAYNIYRIFNTNNETYPYFEKILPYFYSSKRTRESKIDGLKVFPNNHRWSELIQRIETKKARL